MDSDPWVALHVSSLRSTGTSWNIQVQPSSEVAHPGDMRPIEALSSQYAEIAFGDESREVFERIGHERYLP